MSAGFARAARLHWVRAAALWLALALALLAPGSVDAIDAVLAHSTPGIKQWWFVQEKETRFHPPGRGVDVSLLLVDRIAARCQAAGVRLLLVLQGKDRGTAAEKVLSRARERGVPVLDLVLEFRREQERDPGAEERLFDGHMTAAGNRPRQAASRSSSARSWGSRFQLRVSLSMKTGWAPQ